MIQVIIKINNLNIIKSKFHKVQMNQVLKQPHLSNFYQSDSLYIILICKNKMKIKRK